MAKQIAGVSERILAAAKQEFLENGYSDASLRTIAAADTTVPIPSMCASEIRRDRSPPL